MTACSEPRDRPADTPRASEDTTTRTGHAVVLRRPRAMARYTLHDFDYALPPELIAQAPARERTGSRLLHVDGATTGRPRVHRPAVDSSRPATPRLQRHARDQVRGSRRRSRRAGASSSCSSAILGARRGAVPAPREPSARAGGVLRWPTARARRSSSATTGFFRLRVRRTPSLLDACLERHGEVPLPPYIARAGRRRRRRALPDRLCARTPAPSPRRPPACTSTRRCSRRSARPASVSRVRHAARRRGHVPAGARRRSRGAPDAQRVVSRSRRRRSPRSQRRARAAGAWSPSARRACARSNPPRPRAAASRAGEAETALFVTPGYRFRVVDRLLTNFHLPKSTLLMLVAAFAGHENIRAAYAHAIGAALPVLQLRRRDAARARGHPLTRLRNDRMHSGQAHRPRAANSATADRLPGAIRRKRLFARPRTLYCPDRPDRCGRSRPNRARSPAYAHAPALHAQRADPNRRRTAFVAPMISGARSMSSPPAPAGA